MDRRRFLGSSAAAGVAAGAASAAPTDSSQFIELKYIQMRNSRSNQRGRTTDFLEKHHLPMAERAGYSAVGYFNTYLGDDSPRMVVVSAFDSLGAMQESMAAKRADKEFMKASDAFGGADAARYGPRQGRVITTVQQSVKLLKGLIAGERPIHFGWGQVVQIPPRLLFVAIMAPAVGKALNDDFQFVPGVEPELGRVVVARE